MNPIGADEDGKVEIGPYTLVGRLGQGTLGTTYLAVHRGQSRRFAIRILHRHLWKDRAATSLVINEAHTANRMHHPNVVQTLDVGRMANGVPYIVMEYASGPSLDAVAIAGRGSEDRARYWCWILTSVLSGLGHAHGFGIVHGAFTASDVRVTAEGVPKVLGLEASLLRESLEDTFSPRMERQLRYAAPELLRVGGRPSTAADVFAVAVCAWEGLAGQPMYVGSTTAALMQHRMQGTILPLREVAPDLPGELCDTITAAMNPDPLQRPTVQAFAAALRLMSAGVMQVDLATWLERMFPLGVDEAVSGRTSDRSASRTTFGAPRTFLPTPSGEIPFLPEFPPFPTDPSELERDPEASTPLPEPFVLPPRPIPAPPPRRGTAIGAALSAGVGVVLGTVLLLGAGSYGGWVAAHRDSARTLLAEAQSQLDAGRPELARDLLRRVDPADARAAALTTEANHRLELERARVELLTGRFEDAEARVRRVLRESPDDPMALALWAELPRR